MAQVRVMVGVRTRRTTRLHDAAAVLQLLVVQDR